jgi:isoaspartyl peptidase/L-asparaginase-like protein (Ntn-hydrolase superfamily)
LESWLVLNRDGAVAIAASVMKATMPHVGAAVQAAERKRFGQF